MHINTELIKNKQRILIGGNEGASGIFEIVNKILTHIGKPADFLMAGQEFTASNAPIVIIMGDNQLIADETLLHRLDVHILLVHKVTENMPAESNISFEQYVDHLERVADNLPKAGSFIYFEEDNVATMIGKKERADVKNIEYSRLQSDQTNEGLRIVSGNYKGVIKSTANNFSAHAGGAKTLLNRIGINDEQFFSGINAL